MTLLDAFQSDGNTHIGRGDDLEPLLERLHPAGLTEVDGLPVTALHLVGARDEERDEGAGTHNANQDKVCDEGDGSRGILLDIQAKDNRASDNGSRYKLSCELDFRLLRNKPRT